MKFWTYRPKNDVVKEGKKKKKKKRHSENERGGGEGKGTSVRRRNVRKENGSERESDSSEKECPISAKGTTDTTAMIAPSPIL